MFIGTGHGIEHFILQDFVIGELRDFYIMTGDPLEAFIMGTYDRSVFCLEDIHFDPRGILIEGQCNGLQGIFRCVGIVSAVCADNRRINRILQKPVMPAGKQGSEDQKADHHFYPAFEVVFICPCDVEEAGRQITKPVLIFHTGEKHHGKSGVVNDRCDQCPQDGAYNIDITSQ